MTGGHRARTLALGLLALAGAGGMAVAASAPQEDTFLHEEHEGLFPLCAGCHTGIERGDPDAFYPDAALCARCHDGEDRVRVDWSPPSPEPENVRYSHPEHAALVAEAGDPEQSCETCHSLPDSLRMVVEDRVEEASCFTCHAHEAEEHYKDAECATCHAPLAETEFDRERIAGLPLPAGHEASGFVLEGHGQAAPFSVARCATCHTQDRCVACHVDTGRPSIQALAPAPPGMELPPAPAHYPLPDSHADEGWLSAHGGQAPVAECSTCHTTEDCTVCHVGPAPDLVTALPSRADVEAPGVRVAARAPESHASFFFEEAHGTLAAADAASCTTCHTERYCVDCHDGPADGGYHAPGFVARHSAVAYGQEVECANCHDTVVFCRSCHVESGLGSQGRLGSGFHDAEPVWLLRHGQAARQNLEGCVSCHEQRDCMQCHSALGSFQISPHPRDFDPEAAWERNPRTCLACHVRNPVGGGGP